MECIKRFVHDILEVMSTECKNFRVAVDPNNMFILHFVIYQDDGKSLKLGTYYGHMILNYDYPFGPKAFRFYTPNTSFKTDVLYEFPLGICKDTEDRADNAPSVSIELMFVELATDLNCDDLSLEFRQGLTPWQYEDLKNTLIRSSYDYTAGNVWFEYFFGASTLSNTTSSQFMDCKFYKETLNIAARLNSVHLATKDFDTLCKQVISSKDKSMSYKTFDLLNQYNSMKVINARHSQEDMRVETKCSKSSIPNFFF
jgi:ubiquitin-protein ligase